MAPNAIILLYRFGNFVHYRVKSRLDRLSSGWWLFGNKRHVPSMCGRVRIGAYRLCGLIQLTESNGAPFTLYARKRTQGRPKTPPATQNVSLKSLGDKNKEVGEGTKFTVLFRGK